MRIAFYGSSLLSSYWNGAATYYRGIIGELARRGYRVTFYEPDAFGRQQHRDMEPPDWAEVVVYPATIEAARAGEAGKGFAVVANEVKELAQETAKATEDIARRVQAIQGDTTAAVAAIGEISSIVAQISDRQTTIASAVEEQTATTNEIARSVTEAAAGANGIAEDVTQVATAAAETRSGAEDTLKSATELTGMAGELKDLVSRFSL